MNNTSTLDIAVPVEKDATKLFTGKSLELEVNDCKILLPPSIISVIKSRQRNIYGAGKGLIFITTFYDEHRCFPHDEYFISLARKYEPFFWFLTSVPQQSRITLGMMDLPKDYRNSKKVLLVPNGRYFSLKYINPNY